MFFRIAAIFLCLAAVVALAHDSDEKSLASVTAEIAQQRDAGELYVRRAQLYLELRDWQACLADLERAERLGQVDLAVLRAKALCLGGHFAHAVAVLQPLAYDAAALQVRARAQAALGKAQEAAEDCEKALRLIPKPEPDDFLECSDLLCRAGRQKDALALLNRAPQLTVIVERAMQLEPATAALKRLDALIAGSSIPEPLLAKKAALLAQNGHEAESIAAWQNLVQRISAMPPQARGSHAMSKLMQQAQHALGALRSLSITQAP